MRIGLDLDNTIILYEGVFHRHAQRSFGMPAEIPADKPSIRAWFWARPGGKEEWIELQAIAYGTHIHEAELAPGLEEFLCEARRRGIPFEISSHKTEFPGRGPRVNLREAARAFLTEHGFFDPEGFGLLPDEVFFAGTREEKVQRVAERGCTVFVDDLAELFVEPYFPAHIERVLYDRNGTQEAAPGVRTCSSWDEIRALLLG